MINQENVIKDAICELDASNIILAEFKLDDYNSHLNLNAWLVKSFDDLFVYETHYFTEETNIYKDFELINLNSDFVVRKRQINKNNYRELMELLNNVKQENEEFVVLDGCMCSLNVFKAGYRPIVFNRNAYPDSHPNNLFIDLMMRNIIKDYCE